MTFKVQLGHFATYNAKTTPISFKSYILAKHLLHFRPCTTHPKPLGMEQLPEELEESDIPVPVMIANLSVGNEAAPQSPPSSPRTSRRRRSLQCTDCDKVFTHRGDLNKHLRTHSGERPFACPHPNCDKRFSHSSNLRRHIVVHSGDKPFTCEKCGRSFNRKDKLLLHQQTKLCRKRSQRSSSTSSPSEATTSR